MTRPPPAAARSADKPRIRPNTAPPKGRTDTVARTDTQDHAAGRDDAAPRRKKPAVVFRDWASI